MLLVTPPGRAGEEEPPADPAGHLPGPPGGKTPAAPILVRGGPAACRWMAGRGPLAYVPSGRPGYRSQGRPVRTAPPVRRATPGDHLIYHVTLMFPVIQDGDLRLNRPQQGTQELDLRPEFPALLHCLLACVRPHRRRPLIQWVAPQISVHNGIHLWWRLDRQLQLPLRP